MFQRRVADLWRRCADGVTVAVDWALQYQQLLQELADLAAQEMVPDAELRSRLVDLVAAKRARRAPSRASIIRQHLIDAIAPVRSLLVAVSGLAWQATGEHPVLDALNKLRAQYAGGTKNLPAEVTAARLGPAWRAAIADPDRDRAMRALEVATLFALRRALRNGSVWIEHSLSFRGRERLFIPDERWKAEARRHYARLQLPVKASDFLTPLLARVRAGVDAVAAVTRAGSLRVDDELHLAPLAADDENPEDIKLRARIDQRIGEVQLPEVILAVDAEVRFSWIMLGREPRSGQELLMAYAGILAHGTSLCPRLRELRQRHLFVLRGMKVPEEIAAVCEASVDTALIEAHWNQLVHLAASVMSGHASAVTALARFGSAARGDPIYDAGVQLGKLLRTAFLAHYFVDASLRRELRRVLNRGEAVNALKRAIYTGRVGPAQARRVDKMQAVADSLSLLANIVMAWNTAQMQAVLDRWANRRQIMPPELTGRIAPTRLEGINLRGVFRFPLERYAGQILPSQTAEKTSPGG